MLAIRRGAKEGFLNFEIELEREKPVLFLKNKTIREQGDWAPHLELAAEDAYDRLINPSIQTEVRLELKDRSDEEAIKVFRENLENLLLAPPAGMLSVLAVDPGLRTGCKIAVVDDTGKFLEHAVISESRTGHPCPGSARSGPVVQGLRFQNMTAAPSHELRQGLGQSDHFENRCIGADSQGERCHFKGRKSAVTSERADGVTNAGE